MDVRLRPPLTARGVPVGREPGERRQRDEGSGADEQASARKFSHA